MDKANQDGRRIRSLQDVSLAYKSKDPANTTQDPACNPANVVNVIGFVHGTESILDTTMRSWIEDLRVIDQQWTPVSILHTRHLRQLEAAGYTPGFLFGLQTRLPRQHRLVVQWQPVSIGCNGGPQKKAVPRG